MGLSINNDLGRIHISNSAFAQVITTAMTSPGCAGKIWPASKRGRKLGLVPKYSDTELSMYIETGFNEDGRMTLEFNVIVLFGAGIRKTTEILADLISEKIQTTIGRKPAEITINISGIRSRQVARRNTKIVYHYDIDG